MPLARTSPPPSSPAPAHPLPFLLQRPDGSFPLELAPGPAGGSGGSGSSAPQQQNESPEYLLIYCRPPPPAAPATTADPAAVAASESSDAATAQPPAAPPTPDAAAAAERAADAESVRLLHLVPAGVRHPVQFGREVLCRLLALPGRLAWKECAVGAEAEGAQAAAFRDAFAPFDFTAEL